jgi:hypothetical protein
MASSFVTIAYTSGTKYTYEKVVVSPKENFHSPYAKKLWFKKNKLYDGQIVKDYNLIDRHLEAENELGEIVHIKDVDKFHIHKGAIVKYDLT